MRVRTEAARILYEREISPEGHELDRQRLNRTNLIIMKSAIDRHVNAAVGHGARERHNFNHQELEQIDKDFPTIVSRAAEEVFGATH